MFRCSIAPMPDQLVMESRTEASVGPQTKMISSPSGMPTMRPRISLSWRVRTLYRRRLRLLATSVPAPGLSAAGAGARLVLVESATTKESQVRLLLRRQRIPEALHLGLEGLDVPFRAGEEGEEEALHAVGTCEVGPRVAVEELGDPLSAADQLDGLQLLRCVGALVRVVRRGQVAAAGRLEHRHLLGALGEELHERLRLAEVLAYRRRLLAEHHDVDRRVDRLLGVEGGAHVRPGEEVEVVQVGLDLGRRELLRHEQAEHVHAGLLVDHLVSRLLPGLAGKPWRVIGDDLSPLVEDVRDPRVGPLLLAGAELG